MRVYQCKDQTELPDSGDFCESSSQAVAPEAERLPEGGTETDKTPTLYTYCRKLQKSLSVGWCVRRVLARSQVGLSVLENTVDAAGIAEPSGDVTATKLATMGSLTASCKVLLAGSLL